MTISVPNQLVYSYQGDGATTVFAYPVRFLDQDELVVISRDAAGVDTVKILDADYTVMGAGVANGGSITMLYVPSGAETILIYRDTEAKQIVDLKDKQKNPAEAVEQQLDRLTMVGQEHDEALSRAIKLPAGNATDTDGLAESLLRLADSADNIDTVAGISADVTAVAENIDDLTLVAGKTDQILTAVDDAQTAAASSQAAQAGAEAAQNGAQAAKASAEEAKDTAAMYASDAVLQGNVPVYGSIQSFRILTIPVHINVVRLDGYSAAGDGGEASYKRVASMPSHPGRVQSADGAWWEIAEKTLCMEMFGGSVDSADNKSAFDDMISCGEATNTPVVFRGSGVYTMAPVSITNLTGAPPSIDFAGSTLKAKAGSTGKFFICENIHSARPNFSMGNAVFDAGDACDRAWYVHGSFRLRYTNITGVNSTDKGIEIHGESGFGVYWNVFDQIRTGTQSYADQNGGDGIQVHSTGGAYYNASNTFLGGMSQRNKGKGWDIDYANNTHIGSEAEYNDLEGIATDHTYSHVWLGGYSEANHQNFATNGGTSDGTADTSFSFTANSTGVEVRGGRHIGGVTGTVTGAGNAIEFDNDLRLRSHSGGIGLNGANPIPNGVNFNNNDYAPFGISGTYVARLNHINTCMEYLRAPMQLRQSLTVSGGAIDMSPYGGAVFTVSLGADITSITMPTAYDTRECEIRFAQGATPYAVSGWPANVALAGGAYTLTPTAGKSDVLRFRYYSNTGKWIEIGRSQNI